MKYLLYPDRPFTGSVVSILNNDGIVGYSRGMTLEEYEASTGIKYRVVDDDELDKINDEYEESLITAAVVVSEEKFEYALNVLPPERWHTHLGVNLFHVCEPLTGNLVEWYARIHGRHYLFIDRALASSDHLVNKVMKSYRP